MYKPLPKEVTVKKSLINGLGLFAEEDIKKKLKSLEKTIGETWHSGNDLQKKQSEVEHLVKEITEGINKFKKPENVNSLPDIGDKLHHWRTFNYIELDAQDQVVR